MSPLESVTFPVEGYELREDHEDRRIWRTPAGDELDLFYFGSPPDIPAPLSDLGALRKAIREQAAQLGRGLLEVELRTVAGGPGIRTLMKAPQSPTGRTYIGALTLPFCDFSFVVQVQCEERGKTGIRDAVVFDRLLAMGKVTLDPDSRMPTGWEDDPYEPGLRGPMVRNRGERDNYDGWFPEHPLSRARSTLAFLERSVHLDPAVRANSAPFVGPKR